MLKFQSRIRDEDDWEFSDAIGSFLGWRVYVPSLMSHRTLVTLVTRVEKGRARGVWVVGVDESELLL